MFGLTHDQLATASIVFHGEQQIAPPNQDIVALFLEEYQRRIWYVGELVHSLNFELGSHMSSFDKYLTASYSRFCEFGFVKGDELEFLGDLMQELAFRDSLPLLTALQVAEWCSKLEQAITANAEDVTASSTSSLRSLGSRAALVANGILDRLDSTVRWLESGEDDRSLYVRIRFRDKPTITTAEILNSIKAASELEIGHESALVRHESGSFVEVVYTTLLTIGAFQIFLCLVNGCVIQLTELKHRIGVLARKKSTKTYQDLALSPFQQASPMTLLVLKRLIGFIGKGIPWLKDADMAGFSALNILSMDEVEGHYTDKNERSDG